MVEGEVALMVAAAECGGLVTRAELMKALSARQLKTRLRSGALVRVFPAVYRHVAAPQTPRQNVAALLLWAGHGAVLSHKTAAALHGLEGFLEGSLEVTITRQLRAPKGVVVHRVSAISHRDVVEVDDLSVTSVTRTLIDLAAETDSLTLRAAFDHALREKKTTLKALQRVAGRSSNRPGIIDVRALLHELKGVGGPTESQLEALALDLIAAAGLPRPEVQRAVVAGAARRRLDLLFKNQGVVIETDGYATHAGIDSFEDDRARNNSLIAGGLRVLHWTWAALHDRPEELIAELYVALNLRG